MDTFWDLVETYTDSRWWFGVPALFAGTAAIALFGFALVQLHKRSRFNVALTTLALSGAVTLLTPSLALTWNALRMLGISTQDFALLPTATFPAAAAIFDQSLQMGYLGSGLALVGALSALGALGARRGSVCEQCGRERHPSWRGVCPECQLMEPTAIETSLMRLGDPSASGVAITQFGGPAHTALIAGEHHDAQTAWVAIVEGSQSVGERMAIGARLTIGRDLNECRLVLEDDAVSARHAYIEFDNHNYTLHDWGSRNGTRVNNEVITQRVLQPNDTLKLGRTVLQFGTDETTTEHTPTVMMDAAFPQAQLVHVAGDIACAPIPLTKIDLTIGRSSQNDVVIDAPTVSRCHARVRFDGTHYYLTDEASPNGTWLDNTRVLGSVRLHPGQTLRLGNQSLRFECEEVNYAVQN